MTDTTVIICIDGLDPAYLEACETPNIRSLKDRGYAKNGRCIMPSVTNVNNVSLVTASYPETHGISSNYRLVRETGEEIYMESGEYILSETMFQKAQKQGKTSIMITSKDKLRTLLSEGATYAVSAERPDEWVVSGVGPPPSIYSLEVNEWVIRAANYVMSQQHADLVYITTTDYAMHTYAPDAPESQKHMTLIDDAIGLLLEKHPNVTLLITADHGMSPKTRMVDLQEALLSRGIKARQIPIIKDRHIVHHSNLGGCAFLYLHNLSESNEALKILRDTAGVEQVFSRDEAFSNLRLHYERIGDVVVTGLPDTVFGDTSEVELPPNLRSHASRHEQPIPLIGYKGNFDDFVFEENRDIGRYVFERVLV